MRLIFWVLIKYRTHRTLKRMGRLVNHYRASVDRGDNAMAALIHDDIIVLDGQLSELLDRWEASAARREAVRS